ncbi:MFS transporter [Martelella soudanensis]|uniref:MFS transporter n=1 Tax=unclassified Martelella TaxID=2629616 RepID=UPI0015DE4423|nr:MULTISPECIES: MFS transporter [unclassified Martelella]
MADTAQTRTPIPILIALATATLTASLGISIASVLLPTLTRSFSATASDVQWVVLAYLMSVTIAIVSAGRLGDILGHRRVLIAGLAVFVTASVLCAIAPDLVWLVTGRALQGLGGAILIALPMSIARDLVPAERLGTAMGLLGTTSAVGTALGPSLGGVLLAWGDWRMAFWLLTGVASATLLLSVASLPRNSAPRNALWRELDFPGTFVLVIALASYALATSGGTAGIPLPPNVLISGALIAIALFVIVENRVTSPLVPMALLRDRKTGIGFVMNLAVGTIMMSTLVVGPFFLAFALGLNEALIGLAMAVGPVVSALSGIPAGRLTDRLGANRVIVIGLVQTMLGLLCLAFLPRYFGVSGYVVALITLTPAFQLFLAANNTAVLADASKEQRGRLSGLLGLSRNLGLMTGASAMSTLFVVILGTGDAAQASVADIARAFSMTFTAAAGLALVTLGLAIFSHAGRIREASGPTEEA